MGFDYNQSNFKKLLSIINSGERQVIPFVGAGLSIYGDSNDALPQWSQLIQLLINKALEHRLLKPDSPQKKQLESLIKEDKLITATDILINEVLGLPTFRKTIQETLDVSKKDIPPAILELVAVSWSLVVTTNLDDFIERAWILKNEIPLTVLTNKDTTDLNNALSGHSTKPTLLKTHGTLERFETWVLSRSHYDDILNNNLAYVEALKLLYRQTLFFVGFGLSDQDFEPLLEQLTKIYPGGIGDYYALIPEDKSDQFVPLMKKYGLQPIWFKYQENELRESDDGFTEVKECLALIASEWLKSSYEIPIVLKYFPELEKTFRGRQKELNQLSDLILDQQKSLIQVVGFGGEGKTSLVQKWLQSSKEAVLRNGYSLIFGCSFYKADIGRFINALYNQCIENGNDFDIASKVLKVCQVLRTRKILLLLDGFEVVQSISGEVRNIYLQDIIEAIQSGPSTILVTTRIAIPNNFETLNLASLEFNDVLEILNCWGITAETNKRRKIIANHIGRHALSVRIIAGYLKAEKSNELSLLNAIQLSADIPDEADSLRANKAVRILEFYEKNLPVGCILFMKGFSIYERSVPESLVVEIFSQNLGPQTITYDLLKFNLQELIAELKTRRLILSESALFLTCHPLIRDYFRSITNTDEVLALHQLSVDYFLRISPDIPGSLSECFFLFSACYHAAKAKDFIQFHSVFYNRLNLRQKRFLGFGYGAWDECLTLAIQTFPEEDLNKDPVIQASYYLGMVAYSLSRLFRNLESIPYYLRSIWKGLLQNDKLSQVETAIQANCLASTLLLLGEYKLSLEALNINIMTVKNIADKADRYWQLEHIYTTAGRLATRVGAIDRSIEYFEKAAEVRNTNNYDVKSRHELERITHIDALLYSNVQNIEHAEKEAFEILEIGEYSNFPDIICGAYRALATIERFKLQYSGDTKEFDLVSEYAAKALSIAKRQSHLELEIQIRLERIRILNLKFEKEFIPLQEFKTESKIELHALESLIERSGLDMYLLDFYSVLGNYLDAMEDFHQFEICKKNIIDLIEARGDYVYDNSRFNYMDIAKRDKQTSYNIAKPYQLPTAKNTQEIIEGLKELSLLLVKKFNFQIYWDGESL